MRDESNIRAGGPTRRGSDDGWRTVRQRLRGRNVATCSSRPCSGEPQWRTMVWEWRGLLIRRFGHLRRRVITAWMIVRVWTGCSLIWGKRRWRKRRRRGEEEVCIKRERDTNRVIVWYFSSILYYYSYIIMFLHNCISCSQPLWAI